VVRSRLQISRSNRGSGTAPLGSNLSQVDIRGNPGGSPEATRRAFNKHFLTDLAQDWQLHGREVLEWVRRESPASYLKVCAMLVPKEMRVEHSQSLKNMTDEELDAAIGAVRAMLTSAPSKAR